MEEKCFTMLCLFLPYISMNQPRAYIRPLPLKPPSRLLPPTALGLSTPLGWRRATGMFSLAMTAASQQILRLGVREVNACICLQLLTIRGIDDSQGISAKIMSYWVILGFQRLAHGNQEGVIDTRSSLGILPMRASIALISLLGKKELNYLCDLAGCVDGAHVIILLIISSSFSIF